MIAEVFRTALLNPEVQERAARIGLSGADMRLILAPIQSGNSKSCWPWGGSKMTAGYGRMKIRGKTYRVHRVILLVFVGMSDELHSDHECHNLDRSCGGGNACLHRACCNPDHLVPRTLAENVLRSHSSNAGRNRMKTKCPQGHSYSPKNTSYDSRGRRRCRTCSGLTGRGQGHEALKTHCPQKHPYDVGNTYIDGKGGRNCRACHRNRVRASYRSQKAIS